MVSEHVADRKPIQLESFDAAGVIILICQQIDEAIGCLLSS